MGLLFTIWFIISGLFIILWTIGLFIIYCIWFTSIPPIMPPIPEGPPPLAMFGIGIWGI